jgi:hypothetical protein
VRLSILIILIILISCDREDNLHEVVAKFLELKGCPNLLDSNNELVITNEDEYLLLKLDCSDSKLPDINFSDSLLVSKTFIIGCEDQINRHLFYDSQKNKYVYNIEIRKGTCKMAVIVNNWAIVPKFKDDYTVEFNLKWL